MRQYSIAGIVTAGVVWGFYQYAAVRYAETGLPSLNKGMAMSTLFLLGIVLLLGPLSRQFKLFNPFFKYRKELGVLTFYTGLFHVYLSMFPLARRGPFGFYLSRPLSAYPGLIALILMFILFLLSYSKVQPLPAKLWWKIQNWGVRIAFLFVGFHMIVLKYSGWGNWFTTHTPKLPPLALLGTVFVGFVLLVRLSEFFGKSARAITKFSFFITTAFTIWLFI
ncbi:hypothetical protein A3A79_00855 [Candidatus Gottesmanbacteria bacterium RIFCSPLOWO2_01_FULL_43_11b]|uniref:Ferric oxidoreductase domain-containing protein n=1 Tax=Candidatus Gottesmanbacteria bacterium RIFCSPLOWO2_01_FULL_43_11b TaxID=1798392 RepID=A0A1F6AH25_9BACT|nr:MAG: hypothetical protein A3A79_00855 [Candidatus Gottesmanbacteria bacterium RIFCSPLOWO2_01_FULL_43_11b]